MMITDPIGLYVHIPFCLKKCDCCDFSSYSCVSPHIREKYVLHLIKEIGFYKTSPKIKIDSVFFGGGTPSLLSPLEFEAISKAIYDSFDVIEKTEFSMEVNPGTFDRESMASYISCGVNRISIGLQSINDNELKMLGRIHDSKDFYRAYTNARSLGITNVNVDIMYGIPEQNFTSFNNTIDAVLDAAPEHISAYGLILEENTPIWNKRSDLAFPSEDEECDMYYTACDRFGGAGYLHYEISNYSKIGKECRHNLKYWNTDDYIGVGISAHSCFLGKRYFNPSTFDEYLSRDPGEYNIEEILDSDSQRYEFEMMRLRTAEGIPLLEYKRRFGRDFAYGREKLISAYEKNGYITVSSSKISLTEKGFYVSNAILSELI